MLFHPLLIVKRIPAPSILKHFLRIELTGILDSLLDILLKMPQKALHRPRRRIPQRANGVSLDLATDLLQHGNLPLVGISLLHPDQNVLEPRRALPTGGALAARLVFVKVREAANGPDHVDGIVKHGDGGGAQPRPLGAEVVEFHEGLVALRLVEHRDGGAAGNAGLEGVPAAAHSAAVLLDELAEGDGHGLLDDDGVLDVARDGEELGAAVVGVAEGGEPGGPAAEDGGRHRHGLDVGHGGGTAEEPHAGGKGGLQAGLALPALQALDEGRLLAADVGAGPAVEVDVEVVARAAGVLPDEAGGVGLVDGLVQHHGLVEVLAPDVDVGGPRPHGVPGQQAPLDQLVRVLPHDLAVLARPRLGLVGVHHQEARTPVARLGHEAPLQAGREARPAAAAEPRVFDFLDDPVGAHVHDLLGQVVVAPLQRVFEAPVLLAVQVREDAVLVGQASVGADAGEQIGTAFGGYGSQCMIGHARGRDGLSCQRGGGSERHGCWTLVMMMCAGGGLIRPGSSVDLERE
mmetsp:Transcript_20402/g.42802  ORF Transcript_20402/g.42802 Transcript_20402/m.42802 type:complete len:518 (+) Transcript_20402:466-2019(+)